MNSINPYEAPRLEQPRELPLLPESRWHEFYCIATVRRGWWSRHIQLSGMIHAEILYSAAGHGERVFVNGVLAAETTAWHWQIVYPRIDFFLEASECRVPARIDVAASLLRLLQISRFRLTVAGRVVYEE